MIKGIQIKNKNNNRATIYIYGEIGEDVKSNDLRKELQGMKNTKEINVHINSGGGEVFEGNAIYQILNDHPAKINVHIDSLAGSIASVIAMSGDTVNIAENGMLMIHNALTLTYGNSSEMRKMANDLDKINDSIRQSYLSRELTIDEEKLIELMDDETWLTAKEAKELGFVDVVSKPKRIAASITKEQLKMYNNVPNINDEDIIEEDEEQVEVKDDNEVIIELLEKILENQEEFKKEEPKEVEETEEIEEEQNEPTNISKLFLNLK